MKWSPKNPLGLDLQDECNSVAYLLRANSLNIHYIWLMKVLLFLCWRKGQACLWSTAFAYTNMKSSLKSYSRTYCLKRTIHSLQSEISCQKQKVLRFLIIGESVAVPEHLTFHTIEHCPVLRASGTKQLPWNPKVASAFIFFMFISIISPHHPDSVSLSDAQYPQQMLSNLNDSYHLIFTLMCRHCM